VERQHRGETVGFQAGARVRVPRHPARQRPLAGKPALPPEGKRKVGASRPPEQVVRLGGADTWSGANAARARSRGCVTDPDAPEERPPRPAGAAYPAPCSAAYRATGNSGRGG